MGAGGLIGHAAGEAPWSAWSFDVPAVALAFLGLGLFAQGFLRLRRRRAELAPWNRAVLFVGGVALSCLAIVSPIDHVGEEYLQWVHMLQHLLIADLAAALMLVALRGPLSIFFLPKWAIGPLARAKPLRAALSFLLRPWVSYTLWLSVLVVWHIPRLYEAALGNVGVHAFEHLSFVVVGLLAWSQIVDPSRHRRLSRATRLGFVALMFWTGQILAYVIAFTPEPLFETYARAPERLLGLSVMTDQKLAAVTMMVEQGLTLGAAFILLYRMPQEDKG